MIGVSLLLWGMAADGAIGRIDAAVLFSGTIAYTAWLVVQSRRETAAAAASAETPPSPPSGNRGRQAASQVALVLSGLVLLVLGARWLVDGATTMAKTLGVSDVVIGLTIVAAGTSLPEVATSLVATLRGERDIAIGNVIGSNIGNILGVLGLSGLVARGGLPVEGSLLPVDIPVMVLVAFACFPVFLGGRMARWHGAAFLVYYVAYTTILVLGTTANGSDTAQLLARMAVPTSALLMTGVLWRNLRRRGDAPEPAGE
jgi:cation:H+ antiporter